MKRAPQRGLHPLVRRWFEARFPSWTPIQRRAVPHVLAGRNALILAPTGSGKTLAGFLAILSRLAHEAASAAPPSGVRAVYVSPLKALASDIRRNLEIPLAAINEALPASRRLRVEVRTGDTTEEERARMRRRPPHLLLTTPESLSSLLSQSGWSDSLRPSAVLVDEIHALAESKRGALLSLCLERLEHRTGAPLQRIGLSATASPPESVAALLCGDRPCEIAAVDLRRAHRLTIAAPPEDTRLPAAGFNPARIAPLAARLVRDARCTLVFTSTRSAAERLGLALQLLLPDSENDIGVHHSSIGRSARHELEQRLAARTMRAVVCSSSLELGLDFDAVDRVLLAGTPRGVSAALQRLGRAGHRLDGVAEGAILPLSLPDLLEATAACEAARHARLDPLRIPEAPLDILAQVLLGMAVERPWCPEEAFHVIRRAGPYRTLSRDDFDSVLNYLAGGGPVLSNYPSYGKLVLANGCFRAASRRTAREYYSSIGAISDDVQIRIVTRNNRALGEVEEGFLSSLRPGEAFLIGGRSMKVRSLHGNTAVVEPAEGERVVTPRWMGGRMNLSAGLAQEEIRLRRTLRAAWQQGGRNAVELALRQDWKTPPAIARRVAAYVERQTQAAPVPVDSPVLLERIPSGRRTILLLFHSVAGRAVNRSLAWVLAHRFAAAHDRPGVAANFDDHGFALSIDARLQPSLEQLRAWFHPDGWTDDLEAALRSTETLGRKFRAVAEIGQLLPKRPAAGPAARRAGAWSAPVLYSTLMRYEPHHPLLRETVREVMHDQLDAPRATLQARLLHEAPWEVCDLDAPSPFAIPLFAFFHREILLTQDPEKALEDAIEHLYEEWTHSNPSSNPAASPNCPQACTATRPAPSGCPPKEP